MAVYKDNKETLGLPFEKKKKKVGSHLESHRKLSRALWVAALKLEWPCRMVVILPL